MKLTDFLDDIGRPIAYYPAMRHVAGSCTAGILLCQLLYWRGKQADPLGWIYKSQSHIEEETGLSRPEQETARQKLRDRKILREKKQGIPCKLHYLLDLDRINQLWEEYLLNKIKLENQQNAGLPQTSLPNSPKQACADAADKNGGLTHATSIDYSVDFHKSSSSCNTPAAAISPPQEGAYDLSGLPAALHAKALEVLIDEQGTQKTKEQGLLSFIKAYNAAPEKTTLGLLRIKIRDHVLAAAAVDERKAAAAEAAEEASRRRRAEEEARHEAELEEARRNEERRRAALESLSSLPADIQAMMQAESRRASNGFGTMLEWALVDAVERYLAMQEAA